MSVLVRVPAETLGARRGWEARVRAQLAVGVLAAESLDYLPQVAHRSVDTAKAQGHGAVGLFYPGERSCTARRSNC